MTNPFHKILPKEKKDDNDAEASSGGEKQPLLARFLPHHTPKPNKQAAMTPSSETHPTPQDSVRVWDIRMPPIKADISVAGKLIPRAGHFLAPQLRQTISRVTIEIHSDKQSNDGGTVMEGILRGKSIKHEANEVLHDGEYVIMRIFRRSADKKDGLFRRNKEEDKEEDDEKHSVSSISISRVDKVRLVLHSRNHGRCGMFTTHCFPPLLSK